ncbi:MAG: hypothetical protein D6702_05060 [Planctomycetota bacterium]|nr:MAG: hypothetical protein D6702_05060 [Planctomycetota bacterium]
MAGLISFLLLLLALGGGGGEPRLAARRARLLERLDAFLAAAPAQPDEAARRRLFHLVRRLDHSTDPRVEAGWRLLARSGGDRDRANLILHERRHRLPLDPEAAAAGGLETTLELCLALWGEGRLAETEAALEQALARWPEDARLRSNLAWLRLEAPAATELRSADPRDLALAVLVRRDRRR